MTNMREGKMFFSEEKNQKTFIPAPAAKCRPWPRTLELRGNKSLFASFSSEKEGFSEEEGMHLSAISSTQGDNP
jgi:hypothetical protein